MKKVCIRVLVDNQPSVDGDLACEHGLSLWIDTGKTHVLCDMGASEIFLDNARKMGIDLSIADMAFVSHGHADHAGGLPAWLKGFPDIETYLSCHALEAQYFSSRHVPKKDISPDRSLLRQPHGRLIPLSVSTWVREDIALVQNACYDYDLPRGNQFLSRVDAQGERPDDFRHEMAMAIRTERGLIVVSSCSHNGAVNIMESCCRFTGIRPVVAFVGGLHFVNGDCSQEEVDIFVKQLQSTFPGTLIYTGHCTGTMAKEELSRDLDTVTFFRTGFNMNF